MSDESRRIAADLEARLNSLIAGKEDTIRLLLAALFGGGHVLMEDAPGVGKTTLARALAASLGADFGRIQFTADLLPADIVGVEIFDPAERRFVFHPGPVFHPVVLADEINRATPKAQSALLEAMAEGQVTIERETHPLPSPFFVIATQNPAEHLGVFPLPESQLDRFFMRLSPGYPDADAEKRLLRGEAGQAQLAGIRPVADWAAVAGIQRQVRQVQANDALLDYLLALLARTRDDALFTLGASPRAGLDLLMAARAWAWLDGREFVTAADVRACWLPCLAHRVRAGGDAHAALAGVLEQVPVPG